MKKNVLFLILAVAIGALLGGLLFMRYQRSSGLRLAQGYLNKGKWAAALTVVEPIHQANPRDLEAALAVAEARRGLGETTPALSVLSSFIPPSGRDPAALELAGWIHLDAGNPEVSIEVFTELGKQAEWESRSLVGLAAAKVAQSEGHSARLISEARHNLALARSPRPALAYLVLGEVALAERNFPEASSAVEEAIRLLDNPSRAYLLRGKVRLAEHRYTLAESDFRQAIQLGVPQVVGQRQLALAQYQQGQISRATALLEELLRSDSPEAVPVARDLADLYSLGGKQSAAIDILAPLAAESANPTVLLKLYELYAGADREEERQQVLRDLMRRSPLFSAGLIEGAVMEWARGDYSAARSHSLSTYDPNPDNIWASFFLGTVALLDRDPQRAVDYLDAVQQQSEDVPLGVLNAALGHLMLRRPEDARDLLGRAIPQLRGDPRFSRIVALSRQHNGDLGIALDEFRPSDSQADHWLTIHLLLRAYRFSDAAQVLTKNLDPGHPHYLLLKAAIAASQGRSLQAERYISQFSIDTAERDPALADWATLIRAYCAAVTGRRESASELLSGLVGSDSPIGDPARALAARLGQTPGTTVFGPQLDAETRGARGKSPFSSFEAVQGFERVGQRDEAIQLYRALLTETPCFPPALDHLGYLLWLRGNIAAAKDQYEALLELGCEQETVRHNLAGLAWQEGDPEAAEELFVQAEEAGPVDEELRLERCLLELRAGRLGKARDVLETFGDVSGSAIQAARGHLAVAEGRWSTAERLLESSAAERPDDGWVRINRGIALVHLSRYAEGEEVFREAVEIAPALPEAHRLLGQLYASQGLYREAHLSLSTSLRLDPNQPKVRELVDRIGAWIGRSGV